MLTFETFVLGFIQGFCNRADLHAHFLVLSLIEVFVPLKEGEEVVLIFEDPH